MTFEELIRNANKYYATIGVVSAIFIVVIVYLTWLDLGMRKLEKQQKNK